MNILFYTDDPYESALWLDDIRKNKFFLEAAQMMSTAMHYLTPGHGLRCYKVTHPHHPSNRWVRASKANFAWTLDWAKAMYLQRGRRHSTARYLPIFEEYLEAWPNDQLDLTPFANCAKSDEHGLDFTHLPVHQAYKEYSNARWSMDTIVLTWNDGERPPWYCRKV